ncbi:MAG TPA: hypothetical protein VKS43_09060 [Burkholderiales bacterium]|nr:hypothetical protein [Burkholderiales bacterium]
MRIGRAGLVLLAALLLAAAIYAAGARGLADAHYFAARSILVGATQAGRLPGPAELTVAATALRESLALEPSNPLFVEQLGRVQEMRARQLPPGDTAAREALRLALAQYRSAALMRPGSPYVWTGIAALKLQLDETDFEFYGALERAERFGRWEPAVQLALADIGFTDWRLLAQPAKVLVLGAIERAWPRESVEIRRMAAAHGDLEPVCAEAVSLLRRASLLCVKK